MITDMHENFPDAVASGRLDVAIERVYDSQLSGLVDRVAMFPLLWEPQCILMSRTDPLCREAGLPIRVLDRKTAVCGPVDSGDDWEMKQLCEQLKPEFDYIIIDCPGAVSALPEGRAEFCPHPTPAETFEGRPVTASCGQLIHSLKNLQILFTRALQLSPKRRIMRSIHHSAGKEVIL